MKKYMSILFVAGLFITLLSFSAKSASAITVSLPSGCTSTVGFSPLTGIKCDSYLTTTNLPAGCTSTSGFSVTTGQRCDTSIPIPIYPPGCTSYSGFSSTTGWPCSVVDSNSPVITGVSGPQSLNVNQQGTWTVTAYSQNGGNLSYSVQWGDEKIYAYTTSNTIMSSSTQQSATFTHTYSQAATYTPTFQVTSANTIYCITTPCPSNGGIAQLGLSVNVGNTTTPSITVLSPNGGESFTKNFQYKVSWITNNIPTTNNMTVRLRSVTTGQELLVSNNPNTGYAGINIPANFVDGKYKLEVKTSVNGKSYIDASNDSFLITSTTTQPSITSSLISSSANVTTSDTQSDKAQFNFKISVSAKGGDIYLSKNFGTSLSESAKIIGGVVSSSTNSSSDTSAYFKISEGDTRQFESISIVEPTVTGTIKFAISYLGWVPSLVGPQAIRKFPVDYRSDYVNLVARTTQPSVTVLSPNGGETIEKGKQYTFAWSISSFRENRTNFSLELLDASNNPVKNFDAINVIPSQGTRQIILGQGTSNSYQIVIANTVPDGSYKFRASLCPGDGAATICLGTDINNMISDSSNNYFTITSPVVTTQPYVSITSPTANQTFKPGDVIPIRWTSQGITGTAVDVQTADGNRTLGSTSLVGNPGTYDFTLSTDTAPGSYKVQVRSNAPTEIVPFTVASPVVVVPPIPTPPAFSATLLDASSDKVGSFNTFGPGIGRDSRIAQDWHIQANLTVGNKTVSSVRLEHNAGEYWKTGSASTYPIVVFKDGNQINFSSQNLSLPVSNGVILDIYAQIEKTSWIGGKLFITFSDGTVVNTIVPASSIKASGTVLGAEKFYFTQFLSEGSYGNEVRELQKVLNSAGYDIGNVDGIFGAKVKEAVIKLQIANKLKADGIVGYEVRTFLNK